MEWMYLLLGLVIVLLVAILIGIFWGRRQVAESLLLDLRSLRESTQERLNHMESFLLKELSNNRQEITQHLRDNREEVRTALESLRSSMDLRIQQFQQSVDDSGKSNRAEVDRLRSELTGNVNHLTKDINERIQGLLNTLSSSLNAFSERLQQENRENRTEMGSQMQGFRQILSDETKELRRVVDEKITQLSREVASNLDKIRQSNEAEIEKVRQLVSEKLESTLRAQLQNSFEQLVQSISQVHKDLGEMQSLVQEVGDLKRVLTNVKHRGILGEAQLEALLHNTLPGLYKREYKIGDGKVDFAIEMPDTNAQSDQKRWLPIDSKFPKEDLEALQKVYEDGDSKKVADTLQKFRTSIRNRAKEIKKYIEDGANTTDYAIMFLPTESLYAEVVRDQAFFEELYREYRILVTGPSTLIALLNSLRLGFQTVAIERRTQEIVQVLGAIKAEFSKFESVLRQARDKIRKADEDIEKLVGTRTRQIQRKLEKIERLPEISSTEATRLLDMPDEKDSDEKESED